MGGLFILVEVDLPRHPRVLATAVRCGCSPYEVAGRLIAFWGWCATSITEQAPDGSGVLRGASVGALVGAGLGSTEFFAGLSARGVGAVDKAPWLVETVLDGEPAILIPHYDSWLSKSARAVAIHTSRQRRWRAGRAVGASAPTNAPTDEAPVAPTDVDDSVGTRRKKSEEEESERERDHIQLLEGSARKRVLEWCARKFRGGAEPIFSGQIEADCRELCLKLGILHELGRVPEAWIDSGCEAIRHRNGKPLESVAAYLLTVVADEASKAGCELRGLLARVEVPEGMRAPRPAAGADG